MSSRALRHLASWIALVAVVAVTFMPTFSRLMAAGRDSVDLCSVAASGTPDRGDIPHALEHCPYCALHADLALPPPAPVPQLVRSERFVERPAAFWRAPRASAAWSTGQARAPPHFA